MTTCPKCGAGKSYKDPLKFDCGTMPLVDRPSVWQSPACRIRELTAEIAKLQAQYLAECDRQDKQFWEIERLREENERLRRTIR